MSAPRLERLGLVFDRTCPDEAKWDDAYDLAFDPIHAFRKSPGTVNEFNLDIRQGLAQALGALDPLVLTFAWFADAYGDGLNVPSEDRYGGPASPSADLLGEAPASVVRSWLDTCHYVPGLDLWDPLEQALGKVLDRLAARGTGRSAVLIVGNSPPTLPLDGASPFYDLLGRTTTRRRSGDFTRLISELPRRGVAVAYLFLTHEGASRYPDPKRKLIKLQQDVATSLGAYLPLLKAPATAEGVSVGVGRAVAWLAEQSA